tara:strand:- start:2128 stop:4971 length:2844 start_codon:yes stop_codon:yes gene_type:complete
MPLLNAPKTPHVSENWLFQFTADNNTCLEFHPESSAGANDGGYIDCGNALANISPIISFTVEFWLKADDVTSVDFPIISKTGNTEDNDDNDSFIVKLSNNDIFIQYEYAENSNITRTTSAFSISANTWTHIAIVRSADTDDIRVYKNGALAETISDSNTDNDPSGADSSDQRLFIGANFGKTKFFDGELAHLRVWDIARNATQIARYYQRSIDSNATGLVGYWKLDEGNGTTVLDSSSNSNNGTIISNHSDGVTNLPTWQHNGFDQFIHSFGLAFGHTSVSSETYYGTVLNKNITIRESMDIVNGTASTSNISLTVANFTFEGVDFYKHLFNYGEKNYFNKEVRVFAEFNNQTSLSNCQRIFTGRLVSVKLNDKAQATMQINTHRPWTGITFPQDQAENSNIYVPTVYGEFTPNVSNVGSPAVCGVDLYPVPVLDVNDDQIITLMPRAYSSGSNAHINLWLGKNRFLPAAKGTSAFNEEDATILRSNVNVIATPVTYHFHGIIDATESEMTTTNQTFTDLYKAFDGNDNTAATVTLAAGSSNEQASFQFTGANNLFYAIFIYKAFIKFKYSVTGNINGFLEFDPDVIASGITGSINVTDVNAEQIFTANILGTKGLLFSSAKLAVTIEDESSPYGTITLHKVQAEINARILGGSNESDDRRDSAELSKIKFFYSGGAGLTASWDSSAILHGHDIHRDLLMRFAGVSSTEPSGYSALNSDRFQEEWKARYWQLEPTSLKDNLDKLAYEFSFNYKIDASGALKYINVLQTGEYNTFKNASNQSNSNETTTNILNLTKNDITNITIGTTSLSDIVSKMKINFKKHPAENKYLENIKITNTNSVAKYNHGDKEGLKEVSLDYNVGTPATNANPNNNFYAYQNNLIGEIRGIVSCDVVNCALGYQLETGDVVTFSDMPIDFFGETFNSSNYFMIVELKRSIGKVSITAREVA